MLDIDGPLQLLHATHVREKDKALLRSITGVEGRGGRAVRGGREWISSRSCQERNRSVPLLWWC